MRPLKLTLVAFGPFYKETTIDFELFSKNGIYLIAGETGSGKSTIFDAISFALFGLASGSIKNSKYLRSDFADSNTKTKVELIFEAQGKIYKIERSPKYSVLNRNGNKKDIPESASLLLPNGEIISKTQEVNSEIIEILGIDKNQFSQIVMIAQGEFKKMLISSTEEKEKIFRKIFNTNLYKTIQEKIKLDFIQSKNEFEDTKKSIRQSVLGIVAKGEFQEFIKEIKEEKRNINLENIEIIQEFLEKNIKENDKIFEKFLNENEKEEEKKEALIKEINEKEAIEISRNKLILAKNNLQNLDIERKNIEEKFEIIKKEFDKKDELAIEINDLKNNIEKFKEIEIIKKELLEKEKQQEKLKNEKEILKEKLEKNLENFKNNKEKIKNLKDIEIKFLDIKNKIEKNKEQIETIKNLKKEYDFYILKSEEIKKIEENFLQKDKFFKEKNALADEIYNSFLLNQAGILAKNLKENSPCPVCGSLTHPRKASVSKEISAKEVEEKRKDATTAQGEVLKTTQILTKAKTEKNNLEKNIKKYNFDLKNLENFEKTKEEISDILKNFEDKNLIFSKEKDEINSKIKLKNELEKEIENFEILKEELQVKIEKTKEELVAKSLEIEKLRTKEKEKSEDFGFIDIEIANKILNEKEEKLKNIKDNFEKAQKEKEQIQEKIISLNSKIKQLKETIKDEKPIDIEKLKDELEALTNKIKSANSLQNELFANIKNNKNILKTLNSSKEKFIKQEKNTQTLEHLSRLANGELTKGKAKITFENYILANYFEKIIQAANIRFQKMTSGQFMLLRNKQKGGNGKMGLDLDVFDAYTNKVRSITSLSGGELFKAALSMSLGLSDIAQQNAGSITINTMFIDEGFGSLDSESLEQTMKILMELSNKNTQIGIISHIKELKDKIYNKILVEKGQNGSTLKLEY